MTYHSHHAGTELEHHPFRNVLGPDRNALSRFEAGEQRAGGALGFLIELRVGPLTPQRLIGDARNQSEALRRRFRCLAQEVAERHVPDRRRGRSGDVRFRKSHDTQPPTYWEHIDTV